jgi:hypothetical protein
MVAGITCQLQANSNPGSVRHWLADPEFQVAYSRSGQFVVAAPRHLASAPPPSPFSPRSPGLVELSVQTLVVSCETIKNTLLHTLGQPDAWMGRIHVVINPAMTNGQPAIIGARPFLDGWHYQMDLPAYTEPVKVVRTVVHALLLELANRNAYLRSAEIPLWLSEGLTQFLVQSSPAPLVVPRPRTPVRQVHVGWDQRPPTPRDPLEPVRDRLQEHAALSFTRMGEMESDHLSEELWRTFQASAHLFVDQLLQLPHSRAMLVNMLLLLPHHLNWQIAFLKAFRPHFPRMLDAEKWWSVVLVRFSGLDAVHAWSVPVALDKLHDVLHPMVLVTHHPKDLPERTQLSLQQMIDRFDYLKQRILLQDLNRQLALLRVRMPLPVVSILDDYRRTIDQYLERRDRAGMTRSLPGLPPLDSDRLVHETLQKLDQLDQQRAALALDHPVASPAQPTSQPGS